MASILLQRVKVGILAKLRDVFCTKSRKIPHTRFSPLHRFVAGCILCGVARKAISIIILNVAFIKLHKKN